MTISLKKLLFISLTLLLGVMSSGVRAQINVDGYSVSTITTTYTSSSTLFQSQPWFNDANLAVRLAAEGYVYYGLGSYPNPQGPSNPLYSGMGFGSDSTSPVFVSTGFGGASGTWGSISYGQYGETALIDPNRTFTFAFVTGTDGGGGGSAGVPEIDGALAPKVGFLLACLFLMFGRKRENTESLMTA